MRLPVALGRRGLAIAVTAGALLAGLALVTRSPAPPLAASGNEASSHAEVAPEFMLPLLGEQGSLSLAGLRGHVVVLNFWASWCSACRQEAPELGRSGGRSPPTASASSGSTTPTAGRRGSTSPAPPGSGTRCSAMVRARLQPGMDWWDSPTRSSSTARGESVTAWSASSLRHLSARPSSRPCGARDRLRRRAGQPPSQGRRRSWGGPEGIRTPTPWLPAKCSTN